MRVSSVLIVDDHQAFAQALGLAVDFEPDLRQLATASTAAEALRQLATTPADIVLVDIGLGEHDGIRTLPEIRRISPHSRILLITGSDDPDVLARAALSGADGLLRKIDPLTTIIGAIRRHAEQLPVEPGTANGRKLLTDREVEVLELLARGDTVTTIARRLDISVNTCRGYVRAILSKLDAHSQLAAVARADQLGLLRRPPSRPGPQ
jgi:DNA-binding NarL/FixJ family response regulator